MDPVVKANRRARASRQPDDHRVQLEPVETAIAEHRAGWQGQTDKQIGENSLDTAMATTTALSLRRPIL